MKSGISGRIGNPGSRGDNQGLFWEFQRTYYFPTPPDLLYRSPCPINHSGYCLGLRGWRALRETYLDFQLPFSPELLEEGIYFSQNFLVLALNPLHPQSKFTGFSGIKLKEDNKIIHSSLVEIYPNFCWIFRVNIINSTKSSRKSSSLNTTNVTHYEYSRSVAGYISIYIGVSVIKKYTLYSLWYKDT